MSFKLRSEKSDQLDAEKAANAGELLTLGLLMLLKLVQHRTGAVFWSSTVYKAQRSD